MNNGMEEMEISRKITMSVIRLQTEKSVGTGFFYSYSINEDEFIPTIVTNRHVLENAQNLQMTFSYNNNGSLLKENYVINNLKEMVIYHPDIEIDLAVVPVIDILKHFKEKTGAEPEIKFLNQSLIPKQADINKIKTIENILVVGYPNGLWDMENVRPLVRSGITASDFKVNYNGKSEFIIDSAIYPGSSGSPVFLVSEGMSSDGFGSYTFTSPNVKLLGINSAVFTQGLSGKIVPTEISTMSSLPISLGIIIKAEKLLEFKPILLKII